jgi:hypothetical protein
MSGCEIHVVDKEDSLGLGAVGLDIGQWAEPADELCWKTNPPKKGEKVFVIREEDKLYWIGRVVEQHIIMR